MACCDEHDLNISRGLLDWTLMPKKFFLGVFLARLPVGVRNCMRKTSSVKLSMLRSIVGD